MRDTVEKLVQDIAANDRNRIALENRLKQAKEAEVVKNEREKEKRAFEAIREHAQKVAAQKECEKFLDEFDGRIRDKVDKHSKAVEVEFKKLEGEISKKKKEVEDKEKELDKCSKDLGSALEKKKEAEANYSELFGAPRTAEALRRDFDRLKKLAEEVLKNENFLAVTVYRKCLEKIFEKIKEFDDKLKKIAVPKIFEELRNAVDVVKKKEDERRGIEMALEAVRNELMVLEQGFADKLLTEVGKQ